MRNLDLKGLAAVAALASLSLPAAAQLLVYEGFDYTDVAGDDPHVTARNNADLVNDGFSVDAWTSGTKNSIDVTGTSGQSFGSLAVSGLGGTSSGGLWGNRSRTIDLPLEDGSLNNLLADGATLWFSVLVRNTGGTDKLGFALSNGNYISSNQYNMSSGVDGIGIYASNGGLLEAATWDNGGINTSLDSGSKFSISSTTLVVGEIQWNATPGNPDTLTLYTPDASLTQGAAVASHSRDINNTTLDRVAVLFKEGAFIDEIRIGATFADVTPTGGGDTDPPLLSSTNPSNGQTNVQPLSTNLSVTFSEDVAFGTGNITLRQAGGGLVEAFDVSTAPNAQLTLSGGTVTINPSSDLAGTTSYYVEIADTAIDDLAGNSFAGISGDATWSFTTFTPDIIDPIIDTLSPADGATGVATNSDLAITFDENVKFGTGNITLRQAGGALIQQWDVSGPDSGLTLNPTGGTTVTINPAAELSGNTSYYVEIDPTAIDDMVGNSFAGFSGDGTWSFTTGDAPAVILADDFTGHSWSSQDVTVGGSAWDTESGVSASAVIVFDKTEKSTSVAGVINPDGKATTGGWDGVVSFTTGPNDIELARLDIGYHLLDGNGNPQGNANNKTGETTITFSGGVGGGFISGNYTAVGGDTDVTIDRVMDLSGITLAANTAYTMTIESSGGGDGHFKGLDYLDLKGTVVVSGNTYGDWIAGFFPGETDPAIVGLDADPDGDGKDNGVENYFGTAPDAFTQGLAAGAVDTGANTFTFTHPLNATPADDLTATYRWSTDLQSFYDDGDPNGAGTTTVNFVQGAPSGGMVTVTATITGTEIPDKLFADVEVAQNP